MSSLIFNKSNSLPLETAENVGASFSDVVSAAFTDRKSNELSTSKSQPLMNMKIEREKKYKELTGQDLFSDVKTDEGMGTFDLGEAQAMHPEEDLDFSSKVNKRIQKMRAQDPEKFSQLKTNEEIEGEIVKSAQGARKDLETKTAGSGNTWGTTAAGLIGSMGAEFSDPINLLSMPLAAARGAKFLTKVAVEMGSNMGAEVARQPEIMAFQKQVGHQYGMKDAVTNVLFAGAFSAGATVVKEAAPLLFKSTPEVFEGMKTAAKENGAPKSVQTLIEMQARDAHIYDANPMRDAPDLDKGGHVKSVAEIDNAIKEGRPLKTENLGVSDAEIKAIDTTVKPGDPELKINRLKDIEAVRSADFEYEYKPLSTSEPIEGKVFYHGTKADFQKLSDADVYGNSSVNNLYGEGLYLTDNPNVARSYAETKGVGKRGKVLSAKLKNLKLRDIEEPMGDDMAKVFNEFLDEFNSKVGPETKGREGYEALKENFTEAGYTHEQVMEVYQEINTRFSDLGIDGIRHTGGKFKGKGFGDHNVVILFEDVGVKNGELVGRRLKNKFDDVDTNGKFDPDYKAPTLDELKQDLRRATKEYNQSGYEPENVRDKLLNKVNEIKDAVAAVETKTKTFDPKEDYHPDVFPDDELAPGQITSILEASEARAAQEMAPKNLKAIELELDEYLNKKSAENFAIEIDGVKTDVASFKADIARSAKMADAIKVCSIGGA